LEGGVECQRVVEVAQSAGWHAVRREDSVERALHRTQWAKP